MRGCEDTIKHIQKMWIEDRAIIDEALEQSIKRLPELDAVNAAKYIVEGGKRFRGFITLEVTRCLTGSPLKAVDAAIAVELIHSSSLALDDIIDMDTIRRGKPSAWITLGLRKTVMAVYMLVTYAHKIVEEKYGALAANRTINATFNISRGEVLDAFADLERADSSLYEKLILLKTASLFQLAAELGAIAAGRTDLLNIISDYGKYLGLIYQVADDLVDSLEGEDTPVTRLFKRWIGCNYKNAYNIMSTYIVKAMRLIDTIECIRGIQKETLKYIPLFIAKGMLKEEFSKLEEKLENMKKMMTT